MLACFCACLADNTIGFRVGGLSKLVDATPKTQQLVDSVSIIFFGGGVSLVQTNYFLQFHRQKCTSMFVIVLKYYQQVRDDIIGQLPLGYDREQPLKLKAISFREQLVAGFNYFIKVGNTIQDLLKQSCLLQLCTGVH